MTQPKVSIVIRTLNEEKHIGNLLRAIASQDYTNHEVIVVDSGSMDRTLDIAKEHTVLIERIESRDFTFGYSLNIGCKRARGEYLVFASAHVLPVNNSWLRNLIEPFEDSRVAMVYGRQMGDEGAKFSEKRDLQRIFGAIPVDSKVVFDYANNANAAIRRELWEKKSFDEYLFGLEDIDWARHMTSAGHTVHYEPKAAIYHIHRENWNQVYNRYRREAIAAQRIGLSCPPQASPNIFMAGWRLVEDIVSSFPNFSPARLKEIFLFRYHQWRGCYRGWYRDRLLDLNRERDTFFSPATNRAVVISQRRNAQIKEIPLPQMRPGDLLLRVEYVGVCKTDLEVYEGTLGYYKEGLARYPIVPGHEFSGTIVKIGANTKYREKYKVGEAVVAQCILARGEERKEIGVINHDGAYGQFVVVPGAFVHKVPRGMSLEIAALAEPLAVVLRGLRRVNDRLLPKAKIAVIGAGPIGNLCAQVLAMRGFQVSVFDHKKSRLEHLRPMVEDTTSVLRDIEGFDAVVEATGSKEVLERVLKESRMGAMILLLGFPYGEMNYNFEDIVGREKGVVGSVGAEAEDFVEALSLLPELDTDPFIKTILPLSEFNKAWQLQRSGKYLKILLKP